MPMHGFAATRPFVLAESTQDGVTLRLDADEETLKSYPFDFSLKIEYRLQEAEFGVCATITNRGSELMPFGFGFHPGFKWPMPGFGTKTDYVLRLDMAEAAMLRQIRNGILQPPSIPNPMRNGILKLDERLFPFGAMLLPHVQSRTVEYGTRDNTMLSVSFKHLNSLALWTRPPGDFFCIEPWQSFPDEEDFDGEIAAKSRLRHLGPHQEASYSMRIRVFDALLSV
jgi:galactose mutarotase-like enzyme